MYNNFQLETAYRFAGLVVQPDNTVEEIPVDGWILDSDRRQIQAAYVDGESGTLNPLKDIDGFLWLVRKDGAPFELADTEYDPEESLRQVVNLVTRILGRGRTGVDEIADRARRSVIRGAEVIVYAALDRAVEEGLIVNHDDIEYSLTQR